MAAKKTKTALWDEGDDRDDPRADLGSQYAGEEDDPEAADSTGKSRKKKPPPRPKMAFPDTPEQAAIIQALPTIPLGEVLKVAALSGTGKTTLLIRLAESYPDWFFLYLAYNADIAKDAAKRVPENVVVKTTHGLAFGALNIRAWLNVKRLGNIRQWEMERWLRTRRLAPEVQRLPLGAVAADVLATVRAFQQSAAAAIDRDHVRTVTAATQVEAFVRDARRQSEATVADAFGQAAFVRYQNWLVTAATRVWESVSNPEDGDLPLEHDVYLKMYQLSNPVMDYSVVMADEAQDINPCVLSLFLAQSNSILVAVGDENQGIYRFRGAVNALGKIQGRTMPLSQSHRFGPAIADQANRVLAYKAAHFGGFLPLRGTPTLDSRIGTVDTPPYTVICRSNRGVFEAALNAVTAGLKINAGAKDLESAIRYVESVWSVLTGQWIAQMDAEIAEFADKSTLLNESKTDPSLKWVVKWCLEHEDDLADICGRLRAAKTRSKKQADVLLTTVHRGKGLEFNQVILANDFSVLDYRLDEVEKAMKAGEDATAEERLRDLPEDELHLLYVALTRARMTLQPNQTLEKLDTLTPVLARLQRQAGYAMPQPTPTPTRGNREDQTEAQRCFHAFFPDLQDALQAAARYEGWTPDVWTQCVLDTAQSIAENHYSVAFINKLTAIYQDITAETPDFA